MDIQRALAARGYDVGTPNGKAGPKTRAAILAYQKDNRQATTGKLSAAQKAALLAAAGTTPAAFTAASGFADESIGSAPVVQTQKPSPLLLAADRDLATGPADLPIGPDDPAWVAGTWSGSSSCWSRNYTIKIVVPAYSEGTTARLEYKWQDSQLPARGSDVVGRGSGTLDMRRTRRGLEPVRIVSGDKDHPFGDIKIREGQDHTPTFSSAPCQGEFAVRRDPLTVPKRSLPQTMEVAGVPPLQNAAPASPISGLAAEPSVRAAAGLSTRPGITGSWEGELKCKNGPDRQVILRFGTVAEIAQAGSQRVDQQLMSADRPGRIALQVTQITTDYSNASAVWTRLVGEATGEPQGYRFVGVSSDGYSDSPLRNLNLQLNEGAIEGSVPGETCSSLKAMRPDPLSSPQMVSVPAPSNGGSFYAARDIGERCDTLIKWAAPAESEFGEAAHKGQRFEKSVMFVDPQFVPVFGRSLEAAQTTTIGADIYNTIKECSKDPLTRPRVEFLLRAVSNSIVDYKGFTASGFVVIQQRVGKARAALNRLTTAKVEATRISDLSNAIIHLASANIRFETEKVAMSAATKAEISATIRDTLSRSAERLAEQEERKLDGQTAWAKLESIRDLRSLSKPALLHLGEQAKSRMLTRLEPLESTSAASVFEPMLEKAKLMPANVDGLRQMDGLESSKLFGMLSQGAREPLEAAWNKQRLEKQQEALGLELSKPMMSARTNLGLQYGAEWLTGFKQRWQGYENSDVLKVALKYFYDDRKARLREALPAFQNAVNSAAAGEKEAVRDRYLVLEEDRRDPVSLEYDMAMAGI